MIRYEDFVADPDRQLAAAFRYIGIAPEPSGLHVRTAINDAYFRRWSSRRWNPIKRFDTDRAQARFEERVQRFGYSLREPRRTAAVDTPPDPGRGMLMARERGAVNDNYRNLPAPIAGLGKSILLLPRRLTARGRRLPDFLIIGAQRSGTTSLYRHLVEHPGIEGAYPSKGAHYFDKRPGKSVGWYRAHFPRRAPHGPITGEASPYYLFHPHAPARAARVVPDAKLIVMLRDPVERAYSHYQQEYARGFDDAASFEQALEPEPKRLRGERERMLADPSYDSPAYQHYSYTVRGDYLDQILAWREHYPEQQLLILPAEGSSPTRERASSRSSGSSALHPRRCPSTACTTLDPTHRCSPPPESSSTSASPTPNQRLYGYLGRDLGWSTHRPALA